MATDVLAGPVVTEEQEGVTVSEWRQANGTETVELQLLRRPVDDEAHITARYIGFSMDATVSITLSAQGRRELIEELSRGLAVTE